MKKIFLSALILPLFASTCNIYSYNRVENDYILDRSVVDVPLGPSKYNMQLLVQKGFFEFPSTGFEVDETVSEDGITTVIYKKDGKTYKELKYNDLGIVLYERGYFKSGEIITIFYYTDGSTRRYEIKEDATGNILDAVSFSPTDGSEESMIRDGSGYLIIRREDGKPELTIYQKKGERVWEKLYDPDKNILIKEYGLKNGQLSGEMFGYNPYTGGTSVIELWEDGVLKSRREFNN